MFQALVIKELRESAGVLALAIVGLLLVFSDLLGLDRWGTPMFMEIRDDFPFVSEQFSSRLMIVVGALAIALGFKQTTWELWQNTFPFLLHRPAGRWWLIGVKLLVGCGLLFAIGGLAIFAYALLAAAPGNSPTPFYWSMTADEWQVVLCGELVYLGAFVSGIRPARWFGTRLAPLVTASAVAFMCSVFAWNVALIPLVAAIGIFLMCIHYYSQARDY